MLSVGGLFSQFSRDSEGKLVVFSPGVREMAAVQLAINRINNKSDDLYDDLLPTAQVC